MPGVSITLQGSKRVSYLEKPNLFHPLILKHGFKNWNVAPGFIFFSEKAFQWQFLYIFFTSIVALSDGNLYPPASHLRYINVGENVGFQVSSSLTLRIKHFPPSSSSSLSPFFPEGQMIACCRH